MIIVALGANLPSAAGPPENALRAALDVLSDTGVRIISRSRFYSSPAWPDPADPTFINAVAKVATDIPALELLNLLHAVETSFGRRRSGDMSPKNAPRTLDLDLIDYDGLVQCGPPVLPHPRMETRAFVLVPLQEIAPDWNHPKTGNSIAEMIAALGDAAKVPQAL
jgi:2-amino-4-hydroxy-6-hydroxymethyldihydropteridine diphosphokinase